MLLNRLRHGCYSRVPTTTSKQENNQHRGLSATCTQLTGHSPPRALYPSIPAIAKHAEPIATAQPSSNGHAHIKLIGRNTPPASQSSTPHAHAADQQQCTQCLHAITSHVRVSMMPLRARRVRTCSAPPAPPRPPQAGTGCQPASTRAAAVESEPRCRRRTGSSLCARRAPNTCYQWW